MCTPTRRTPSADPPRRRPPAGPLIDELLADQNGVIARSQALAAGLSRSAFDRRCRTRRWHRVLPGVWTVADPAAPLVRIRAASLWAGPGAVIGGRAALVWHGLLVGLEAGVDLYVAPGQSRSCPAWLRLRRSAIAPADVHRRGGLAVTAVARACLDLARWGADQDYLDLALRRRAITPEHVSATVPRLAGTAGYARAVAAADSVATSPWSPPERVLHAALTAAGLTGWVANARLALPNGGVRPDVAFRDIKLAIEVEGRRYHDEAEDRSAFERDRRREQHLFDDGWVVLRFSARQIYEDLPAVMATIEATVARLRALAA